MEYIQSSPNNLDKYIEEFHSDVKEKFANSLSKIYNEEINVYRDLIETVVKLPFIQGIINENNMLTVVLCQARLWSCESNGLSSHGTWT